MNYYYITGTSRGIGFEIASLILEDEKSYVFGIGRECSISHKNYEHFYGDLSDVEIAINYLFNTHTDAEKIVLINNAGVLGDVRHVGDVDNRSIVSAYNVNIVSPSILMNNFIRHYKGSRANKIILNVSSGAGLNPVDGWSSYCASKSALDMYSKVVSEEQKLLGEEGAFKVFSVAPGKVDTNMQAEVRSVSKDCFSRLEYFQSCKENGELTSPRVVAEKYLSILKEPTDTRGVVFYVD